MRGLLRRAATGAIFVLIMLAGLFGGPYSFVLLFAIITGACLWEYLGMMLVRDEKRDRIRKLIGLLMGLLPVVLSALVNLGIARNPETFVLIAALLFSPFIFMAFIYELLFTKSDRPFENVAFIMLGIIYIGMPFALLNFIAFDGDHFYAKTVFGILLLTWLNDTGAFVVGSLLGKTPLMPRISPKKTWEGAIGGVAISLGTGAILFYTINQLSLLDWLVIAIIVSVFGSIGDLVESMLKRSKNIKDSGTLLPGHGGLLDRFDGFIFCVPFVAAYLLWLR